MPETDYARVIAMLARQEREAKSATQGYRFDRDRFMRDAHANGHTYYALAQWSGLSIAQVQRICDLSKDRSE